MVVPRRDDNGPQRDGRAVGLGLDAQLPHVEAHARQPFDTFGNPPRLARVNGFFRRELTPQVLVGRLHERAQRDDVDVLGEVPACLEVHHFADDVDARGVEVVGTAGIGKLGLELPCLGVDEVGRVGVCVAPEKRVGQGDVAPVKPQKVQTHEQDGKRLNEFLRLARHHVLREELAVRQRELEVFRNKRRRELAIARVIGLAASDDGDRCH